MINENIIQSPYGVLCGIVTKGYYPSGKLRDVILNEKNMVVTHAGDLIPFYSEETTRRKYKSSITYFENGMIKCISLNEQTEIITPIGDFPCELITFYDTGELKRIFILDGKITGFWSEDDERNLNIPFTFEFEFSKFCAMLVGICFYKSGSVRSLTLFPDEIIEITTKHYGNISVKTGFSLYENGLLKSIEPASPILIETPIGKINAYDINSLGIHADSNSIEFDETQRITKLTTSNDKIIVQAPNGFMKFIVPIEIENPLDEEEKEIIPIKLTFNYTDNTVTITDDKPNIFLISECKFNIIHGNAFPTCSPSDCASCKLCSN